MTSIKNMIKPVYVSFFIVLIITFLVTVLNYFNIFSFKLVNILSYIIPFVAYFIGGYMLGKKSQSKGFLEGLKLGSICLTILMTINIILFRTFNISTLISYIVVLAACMLGSILGINKKG